MNKNTKYIHDAAYKLEQMILTPIVINDERKDKITFITIGEIQFAVEARPEIRSSSKGIVLQQLRDLKANVNKPTILISKYIASEVANEFRAHTINYIDIAGNAYIMQDDLFIFISGQKVQKTARTNQARAFQESGIKLIFNLLREPDNLRLSYRELSKLAGISIGSVSNVIRELEDLNFILRTNKKCILKNPRDLLDRWIIAYHDVLRPRIVKKRMHFEFTGDYLSWKNLPFDQSKKKILWGGEPAAAILTKNLRPEKFSIYTQENWQVVAKEMRLIPDESGKFEILDIFWKSDPSEKQILSPSLLIYADLIGSGIERNIQIADDIFENELQYLK